MSYLLLLKCIKDENFIDFLKFVGSPEKLLTYPWKQTRN
jgi:hypothetical protein